MNTNKCLYTGAVAGISMFSALSSIHAQDQETEKQSKPNILFIFSDDLTYEAVGALGMIGVKTPNLDKIMHNGVHFTHAYNMGAWGGAVCVASRSMLNSGRFVNRAQDGLKTNPQWAELMKKAGYKTYMTGKWHVPGVNPLFDVVKDVRPGMPKQTKEGYNRPKDEEDYKNGWKPWDKSKGGYWQGGTHWSKVVADNSIDFLNQASKEDKPFFMYLAFNAPHDPRQSPKEYIDMYPLDSIKIPKNFLKEYPYKDAMGCSKRLRDERLAPFPRTEFAVKVQRQEYYAAVTYMDYQIGRILEALKKSGKADNTYIFLTADHGIAVGHHGLIGKQNMFDHSMRTPFFIDGPGIKKGSKNDTPIYLQDIMPTTLALAGAEIPKWVEFKSLLPILKEDEKNHYNMIYGKYMDKQRMILEGDYKLIIYPYAKKYLLFNLKKDPDEMNNLADNPEYASKLASLKNDFLDLQKKMGDTLDIKNPKPPKNKKRKHNKNKE
jgi:choline-sulfatase